VTDTATTATPQQSMLQRAASTDASADSSDAIGVNDSDDQYQLHQAVAMQCDSSSSNASPTAATTAATTAAAAAASAVPALTASAATTAAAVATTAAAPAPAAPAAATTAAAHTTETQPMEVLDADSDCVQYLDTVQASSSSSSSSSNSSSSSSNQSAVDVASSSSSGSDSGAAASWDCAVCTYKHCTQEANFLQCAMCGTFRRTISDAPTASSGSTITTPDSKQSTPAAVAAAVSPRRSSGKAKQRSATKGKQAAVSRSDSINSSSSSSNGGIKQRTLASYFSTK
jgi:hypothetical protein